MHTNTDYELRILEEIERNPDTTQAALAAQLGVAVGSVNFVVKRLRVGSLFLVLLMMLITAHICRFNIMH